MSILGMAGRTGVQNHLTIAFPLKSPADAKVLPEQLPSLMPSLAKAADAIGTLHYSRFVVLSEKTLLFLADFDGEFEPLLLTGAPEPGRACWFHHRPSLASTGD